MKITGSPQLKEVVKNQEYNIEYGTIKYGDNTLVNIKLEDVEHVSVSKTCGCTTPTVEIQPNGVTIAVSYTSFMTYHFFVSVLRLRYVKIFTKYDTVCFGARRNDIVNLIIYVIP